jgi:RHS repeat-associated protein
MGVVVSACLYDDVGRAAVITKHARYADPVPKYQPTFATLDWSSGIMSGDVAASNPEDESFPYSRKRYEDSPTGRVVEVGQPGKVFAVGQGHTTKFEYGANQAGGFPVALNLPGGRYFEVTATNPDGVVSVAIADVIGRKVAHGTLLDAQTKRYVTSSRSVRYTSDGRVITNFLPNYYNPPDPEHKSNWVLTQPYDMLGRLLSATDPDSGVTKFVYDVRGNVRFSQDATAAEQGIVVYSIYDPLGQMLERGTFAFGWDQAQLQQQADGSPSWPGAAQGAKPRYLYSYTYSGDDPNQFGRLTATEVIDSDNPGLSAQVAYSYNPANQLKSEVVRNPQYGIDAYTFSYGYDNLGRGDVVTYPSGLSVQTQRGPLGKVKRIASGAEQFAAYDYTSEGQVKTETLNPGSAGEITRNYSYNSPGWLTSVDDGLFSETIDYTENGFGGAAYYSGQIAHVQSRFAIGSPGSFPTKTDYACEYDALARLKVAQCLVNGQPAPDWSIGTQSPVTYDDHGNFLSFEQGGKTEKYTYNPGSDFVTNTTGSGTADFESSKSGAVTASRPRGISSIQYDAILGKATLIQLASGEDLRFAYDADGRRSLKTDAKLTRLYLSGRNHRPLSEKERPHAGGLESTIEYVYGPTGVLGVRRADGYFTILRDHLGSTRAVVAASKTPVAAYHYLPFGQVADPVFGQKNAARYLFTGYEFDSQTGLYNAGARLYDPLLRRFYSVDPAHQFASPYIYAGNNPILMVDPSGTVSAAAIAISSVITVVGVIAAIFTFGVGAAFAAGADAAVAIGDVGGALAEGALEGAVNAAPEAGLTVGEKAVVGVLTTASATVLGAGTSGIQYGATHNGFDGKEFGKSLGIGALGGAVSGAAGYGISLLDGLVLDQAISGLASAGYRAGAIGATALRSGLEGAVAALPGQVASNAVSHDPLSSGLLTAFVMGLGEGAALGAVQESLFPSARARAGNVGGNDDGGGHGGGDQPGGDQPGDGGAVPQDHPQVQQPVRQAQAPEEQSNALVLWRPSPLAELQSNMARAALERSIPRSISQPLPSLERLVITLPRTVVDLPNGRITIVDQSIFNLPPKVTIEFHTYLALTWH